MTIAAGISLETRALVLDLYGSTCQLCARGPGDHDRADQERRTHLVVALVDDSRPGGDDALCNLHVVCRACEASPPASPASPGLVALMEQLRRATIADQRKALEWLQRRLSHELA